MSTHQITTGAGMPAPATYPTFQPEPRCHCDHLLNQHSGAGLTCNVMVIDGESSFRHRCRCGGFRQNESALEEALSIIENRTLRMPQAVHLEAIHEKWLDAKDRLDKLEEQVSAGLFFKRVAEKLYGKFSVECDTCQLEREFASYSTEEAVTSLRDEGWDVSNYGGGDWKLICLRCFQKGR